MFKFMVLVVLLGVSEGYCDNVESKRTLVIGAGVAGLSSARYLKEAGINFTVLEATRYVGGIWRYDPRIGTDENGLPMHTSMYKYLRTNLPKPTMELGGFPLAHHLASFPRWNDYYHYLQAYARHFDVLKFIKFLHTVTLVTRKGDKWSVKYENVQTKEQYEEEFDFVIVGNGHLSKPKMPDNIPGEQIFRGSIIHSHDYRIPQLYKGRKVMIIGAGPSGFEIALDVAAVSQRLVHSKHTKVKFRTPLPSHYVNKPDVKELNATGALFVDGTFEELDDIIYCTGYLLDYPFLDESSGLTIGPKTLTPLYRYTVNINQPSMIVVGLVVRGCLVMALDAQARYATAIIKGNFTLPPHDEMMNEWQAQVDGILKKQRKLSSYLHTLAENEDKYYEAITEESGIARVPPVMFKIRYASIRRMMENLYTYRNYEYTVIDDYTARENSLLTNHTTRLIK